MVLTFRALLLTTSLLAFGAFANAAGPVRYTVYVTPEGSAPSFGRDEPLVRAFHGVEDFVRAWPWDASCGLACARRMVSGVDFARYTLVVVALGAHEQAFVDVSISSVVDAGDHIEVAFIEHRYAPSTGEFLCNVTLAMPRPAVAVLISRTAKPIHIHRKRALIACEPPERVR